MRFCKRHLVCGSAALWFKCHQLITNSVHASCTNQTHYIRWMIHTYCRYVDVKYLRKLAAIVSFRNFSFLYIMKMSCWLVTLARHEPGLCSCHLLGRRLQVAAAVIMCCCCCCKQMWWGMNYYDNHSTHSPSPHNAKRRDAIAINSQREVVNHPPVGGQEFALHKWKLKRRAPCCYLELVSGEKCFHAAGGV